MQQQTPFHRDYHSRMAKEWWNRFDSLPQWARQLIAESGSEALDDVAEMWNEEKPPESVLVQVAPLTAKERRALENKKRDQEKKARSWMLYLRLHPIKNGPWPCVVSTKTLPPEKDKIIKVIVREKAKGSNE